MTGEELKQQIALYESADHTVHLDVKVDEDTVWLNRQQLALLFGRDIKTIGKHIGNALREELNGFSVVAEFATTASDGKTYQVEHYNLDMILSVGYRVKSKEGIYSRRWANSVLKQHLVDGYIINRKRLDALHAVVKVLSRSTEPEIAGTAEILERYLPSLVLLNDYDTGNVPIPKGDESQWVLTYEDAMLFIRSMPFYTQSDLFGRERNGSFQGIVAGLYQTFGGEELYRSTQEKAANLLYQVVKDHPFSDGNKSTGFSTAGANFHDVELMVKGVHGRCKVKAAGGISTVEDMETFLALGADRLGTSRAVKILNGEQAKGY